MNPVHVEKDRLVVPLPEGPVTLPRARLPAAYADWVERGRRRAYEAILAGRAPVRFFAGHLPVVVTQEAEPGSVFPFNCGRKGVGFLPRAEHLEAFVALFEETLRTTRGRPWEETLRRRVEAVSRFYLDRSKIDLRAFTSLEIFRKRTFRNLRRRPLASLLFTGEGPDYVSFQVDCAVEIVGPEDPRHAFIRLARVLFEYDPFHLTQPAFPVAYVLHIARVRAKTPYRLAQDEKGGEGGLPWRPEARAAVGRAPPLVRPLIRRTVERYARERGFTEVTGALLEEARSNLMDGRGS